MKCTHIHIHTHTHTHTHTGLHIEWWHSHTANVLYQPQFPIVWLLSSQAWWPHWVIWGKRYVDSLCNISNNCMWTYSCVKNINKSCRLSIYFIMNKKSELSGRDVSIQIHKLWQKFHSELCVDGEKAKSVGADCIWELCTFHPVLLWTWSCCICQVDLKK